MLVVRNQPMISHQCFIETKLVAAFPKKSLNEMAIMKVVIALTVICTFNSVEGLTAFDCNSKSVNLTSLSLVTTPSCDISHKNITYEQINLAVTQTTERYELPFFRCHVESRSIMGRCGHTIDTFHNAGLFSEIIRVDRHECDTMHKKKTFRIVKEGAFSDIQLNQDGQTRYSYVSRGSVSPSGSCTPGATLVKDGREYERPLINTELTITISSGTSIVSVEESLIKFPNGKSCRLQVVARFQRYKLLSALLDTPPTDQWPAVEKALKSANSNSNVQCSALQ